jgi:hypothetical protein
MGVDDGGELVDRGEVAQGLDAAGGGAGADRHQVPGDPTDLLDPLGIVRRRHRALDERDVVGTIDDRRGGFQEVGDLDGARHLEQLVLAVEQGELAAVTGGELPDRELGRRGARRGSWH